MTKFCSAPLATHPNKAVAKAWASPFDAEAKYAEPETKHFKSLKGSHETPSKLVAKPATTLAIDEDEESEHSDIDDAWENYAPSALLKNQNPHSNSKTSVSYEHEDDLTAISAITMSTRPDRSRGTSPRRTIMRGINRGRSLVVTRGESPARSDHLGRGCRVRPRSPTPPRNPFASHREGDEEGSMKLKDASGEEGSISLHNSSQRSSTPVDKGNVYPFAYRQKRTPTVPRYHTPRRIRFGEGQSDPNSPRGRDQSPCVPQRLPSRHDRSDEDKVSGIPVLPNLFQSQTIIE